MSPQPNNFPWQNPFSWSATPTPSNSGNNSAGSGGGSGEQKSPSKEDLEDEDKIPTPKRSDDDDDDERRGIRGGRGRGRGGRRRKLGDEEGVGKLGDDHEMHIWTERERRKKMRNMFANLHALLPQLPPKADKSTIVDEAVNYIKTLEQTLQDLQKQKQEKQQSPTVFAPPPPPSESREAFLADHRPHNNQSATSSNNIIPIFPITFQTWTSANVVLNVCGNEAQISICAAKKSGLFTTICYVLEKHKIEVVSTHVSSDSNRIMYMIHARGSCGGSNQSSEAFHQVEETFKHAAGEIIYWVNN